MKGPTRPALRWHGGKWLLAPWIIGHFPPHRIYVEPFGGGASVLLRKPRAYAEVYNDLDQYVVTLFRVLQDPAMAPELLRRLELTPFAREEFALSWEATEDPIEVARRLIMRSFMGFGSHGHSDVGRGPKTTGFRADSNKSGSTPALDWRRYPNSMPALIERFRGVVIENRDAMAVMAAHDRRDALHYVDPPYLHETRGKGNAYDVKHRYRHELTDDDHQELLAFLLTLEGMVVLSGYPAESYDLALEGWLRVERAAHADGARDRVEVLWINPQAAGRLQRNLFEESH